MLENDISSRFFFFLFRVENKRFEYVCSKKKKRNMSLDELLRPLI